MATFGDGATAAGLAYGVDFPGSELGMVRVSS